jgi:hypothetical protein
MIVGERLTRRLMMLTYSAAGYVTQRRQLSERPPPSNVEKPSLDLGTSKALLLFEIPHKQDV